MSDVQIHWFAIVNSVVIVLFLSGKSFSICLIVHMFAINTPKRRVYMRMYDLKLYTVLSYVPNLHYQMNMCTLYVIGRLMSSLIHLINSVIDIFNQIYFKTGFTDLLSYSK